MYFFWLYSNRSILSVTPVCDTAAGFLTRWRKCLNLLATDNMLALHTPLFKYFSALTASLSCQSQLYVVGWNNSVWHLQNVLCMLNFDKHIINSKYFLRLTFFSVSFSHLLCLHIWCDLSFLHGAQSPQLSFRWQPIHSPHLFLFFLVCDEKN